MQKVCSVESCERPHESRTYCKMHYKRFMIHGDPLGGRELPPRRKRVLQTQRNEYEIWLGMHYRCSNPKSSNYKNYGGRGIRVCGRWSGQDGFKNFIDDVGERPSMEFTIDRIDNDRGYEPGNVRWADRSTQNNNRRCMSDKPSGFRGIGWRDAGGMKAWRVWLIVDGKTKTIGYYKHLADAIGARVGAEEYFLSND